MPYTYQDHVHDILPGDGLAITEKLRDWAGEDCFLIGEVTSGNQSVELACGLTERGRLDAAYTTDLPESDATADAYCDMLERADGRASRLGWWLSSHDQARHAAKAGDGSDRDVRFLALMLAMSPGPVLLFQGEELGLAQPDLARHEVTDVLDLTYWPDGPGRQGARMPIPWREEAGWGFSRAEPWMRMNWPMGRSIAAQRAGPSNMQLYRQALRLRREERVVVGGLEGWARDGEVVTLRYAAHEVRLNFGREAREAPTGAAFLSWEDDAERIGAGWLPGRTGAVWRR
jgi:alpha-glucosidase